MALLYVDLLGTQARFERGIDAARQGIRALERVVIQTLNAVALEGDVRGATETDSAALQFDRKADAITFGIELFRRAFRAEMARGDPLWLRGIIVRSSLPLHPRRELDPDWPGIERVWSSPAFLAAAIKEKAGYRGMRLLVEHRLVAHMDRKRFGLRFGETLKSRFRTLDTVPDSAKVAREFREVLWMWTSNPTSWKARPGADGSPPCGRARRSE